MRIVLVILLVLLLVPGWTGEEPLTPLREKAEMSAHRVALDPVRPARRRVGRLWFQGGVALTSRDPGFGGFSALAVIGDRVTLLSDNGQLVRFRLDAEGRAAFVRFGALPAGPGTGWSKPDRDSESLARDPATGEWLVGFENANEIWRYSPDFTRAVARARPAPMRKWLQNLGAESLFAWRGGYVAIQETGPWTRVKARRQLVRFAGDPLAPRFAGFVATYIPPKGMAPSDAVALPDGDVLILNRYFKAPITWRSTIVRVAAADIAAGATVRGRPVAHFAAPLASDNFEGIALTYEGRRAIVWLVSDDNQSVLQRSLLLRFRYPDGDR